MAAFRPFLAIVSPTTCISITKLKFKQPFWGAEVMYIWTGLKVMTQNANISFFGFLQFCKKLVICVLFFPFFAFFYIKASRKFCRPVSIIDGYYTIMKETSILMVETVVEPILPPNIVKNVLVINKCSWFFLTLVYLHIYFTVVCKIV